MAQGNTSAQPHPMWGCLPAGDTHGVWAVVNLMLLHSLKRSAAAALQQFERNSTSVHSVERCSQHCVAS